MGIFETIFVAPIYNFFIFTLSILGNVAWIFILVIPVILSIITFPLIIQSTRTGIMQGKAKKEIDEIREKYKDNPQEQGKHLLNLYKEKNIKPFSSLLSLVVSLIIIITASLIMIRDEIFNIREDLLYSFVTAPESVNALFLGIDLTEKSLILAILAGAAQYFLINQTMKEGGPEETEEVKKMKRKIRGIFIWMFPGLTAATSFFFGGAVALYWAATALVALIREITVIRKLKEKWNKEPIEAKTT